MRHSNVSFTAYTYVHLIYKLNRKQKELEQLIAKVPPEVFAKIEEREREARKKHNRGWER